MKVCLSTIQHYLLLYLNELVLDIFKSIIWRLLLVIILKKFFKMWEVFSLKQGLKNIIKSLLYKNSKFICGFWESHLPYSILKSTIQIVWEKEKDILEKISASCYRSASDVYIWLFSHWQIVSIQYSIGNPKLGGLFN
mgnify:CR=1 FL=1